MMDEKKTLNLNFYKWEEIKEVFSDKKLKNVILKVRTESFDESRLQTSET